MGQTYKQQQELAAQLTSAADQVTVGATYQHYKGADKLYTVTGLGFLEATTDLSVIYRTQYGEQLTLIRPLNSWLELVEWEGETVKRFTEVSI